jgi:hypothetical protein
VPGKASDRSIKNTQIYADVTNEAIKTQVQRLWGELGLKIHFRKI